MLTIKYGLIRRKSDKDCVTQIILNSQKNIYLYMRDLLACFCIILTITFSILPYRIDSPPPDKLILIIIVFTAPSIVFHIQHVQPFSKNLQIFYFYFKL